jgi:hypothetical protein
MHEVALFLAGFEPWVDKNSTFYSLRLVLALGLTVVCLLKFVKIFFLDI